MARKTPRAAVPADPRETALRAMEHALRDLASRRALWTIWSDFLLLSSCSISNAVDVHHRDEREAAYMQCIGGYSTEEANRFAELFAQLTLALEASPTDILGTLHQRLELHKSRDGQYFTPWNVAECMAKMSLHDAKHLVEERGFIRAAEPCVGSGVMMIALAAAMQEEGINYQQHLCVTAVDTDITSVHMAYLQFSLLGIPAEVIHGNSLSGETWSHWLTPLYIMHGFWYRQQHEPLDALPQPVTATNGVAPVPTPPAPVPPPEPAPARLTTPTQMTLF